MNRYSIWQDSDTKDTALCYIEQDHLYIVNYIKIIEFTAPNVEAAVTFYENWNKIK